MSGLLPYLIIGVVLLALVAVLWRRSLKPASRTEQFSGIHEAVLALRANLLPSELADRIFSSEDLGFAASKTNSGIVRILEQERKAIAISWLLETRRQVTKLMRFHLTLASLHAEIRERTEIKLAFDYLVLYVAFELFLFLVWMRGPFHARRIVGPIINLAAEIWSVYAELIGKLELGARGGTQFPSNEVRILD